MRAPNIGAELFVTFPKIPICSIDFRSATVLN
jgi:hypothetical protein